VDGSGFEANVRVSFVRPDGVNPATDKSIDYAWRVHEDADIRHGEVFNAYYDKEIKSGKFDGTGFNGDGFRRPQERSGFARLAATENKSELAALVREGSGL
jgi:hypothetical protein